MLPLSSRLHSAEKDGVDLGTMNIYGVMVQAILRMK